MKKEDKMCCCGRGKIEYDEKTGVSLHSVWLEGSSFGRQEYGESCKRCAEEQRERLLDELDEY